MSKKRLQLMLIAIHIILCGLGQDNPLTRKNSCPWKVAITAICFQLYYDHRILRIVPAGTIKISASKFLLGLIEGGYYTRAGNIFSPAHLSRQYAAAALLCWSHFPRIHFQLESSVVISLRGILSSSCHLCAERRPGTPRYENRVR